MKICQKKKNIISNKLLNYYYFFFIKYKINFPHFMKIKICIYNFNIPYTSFGHKSIYH